MNESYIVNKLFIGNIHVSMNLGGNHGPIGITKPILYIFYKQEDNKAIEVLSGDIFNIPTIEDYDFNKKYIINRSSIDTYLTEDEIRLGTIMKWRLIEIYNQINFSKNNSKKYVKTKN